MSGNLVPRWVKRTYQDKQVGKARALLGHREAAAAEHRDGWGRFIYVKQSKAKVHPETQEGVLCQDLKPLLGSAETQVVSPGK
jgi:hypothetical protein